MPTSVGDVTPYAALQARVRRRPAQPLVTFYDLATGERMELSAASLDNAVAKTAGLMRDELGVLPGDRIDVHLPLHWQRVVWWGACTATGAQFVSDGESADGGVAATPSLVVFDRDHLEFAGRARDDVVVSLEPFGLPSREPVPAGVIDHAIAARAHPDVFVPFVDPPDDGAMRAAEECAAARGLAAGARVLVMEDDPDRDLLMLAVPLAIDGSAVLVRHATDARLAEVLEAEGIEQPP